MRNSDAISVQVAAATGTSWLAIFKGIAQAFSWVATILIARILLPDDYGLMAKATIITGYAQIFSELGLGAAIIQRKDTTHDELSFVFWFSITISLALALSCIPAAYATAWIMKEPRVIPLTMAVGIIFVLTGLQVVPLNILKRDLNFKAVGLVEMTNTIVSCVGMLLIAVAGGGAWALLGGSIIRALTGTVFLFLATKWLPKPFYSIKMAGSYIRFGMSVATGRSLFYIWQRSGTFFAGRLWGNDTLGYYTLAMQLAKMPTDKIVSLINQVSYSAFSRLQDNKEAFRSFYLSLLKIIATITLPLFVGGYLVGDDLIMILLGAKWMPSVFLFKCLCISQIFAALTATNNLVHLSLGKPNISLYYQFLSVLFMPVSFYFCVQYGLNAVVIPWITIYILLCAGWTIFTLRSISITLTHFSKTLFPPACFTLIMSSLVMITRLIINMLDLSIPLGFRLIAEILIGATAFLVLNIAFNKTGIKKIATLIRKQNQK